MVTRRSARSAPSLRWSEPAMLGEADHASWLAEALAAAHAQAQQQHPVDHSVLSRGYFAQEQLQLVQKYQRICARLQRYGNALRTKATPLVPVHFPVTPLPNTRVSMAEGISRALVLFCRRMHETTLAVAPERLAPVAPAAMAKLVGFVQGMAAGLWEETRAVINEERDEAEARAQMVAQCEQFATECVLEERARLGPVRAECDAFACALRDFLDKRALSDRQLKRRGHGASAAKARVVRTWLRGLVRRGHGGALRTLLERRAREIRERCSCRLTVTAIRFLDEGFERVRRDTAEDRQVVDADDWAAQLYDALRMMSNVLLHHAVAEGDTLRWLEEQHADARCWCSTVVVEDAPEIAMAADHVPLLQAPGHLAVFARGRLRLLAPSDPTTRRAELAGVRMARLLAALLREEHLPLNRLGSDYANRIVVCEYCKYERAVLSIEAETLVPFGQLVRVPYKSAIPDLATARRAQRQPHSPTLAG